MVWALGAAAPWRGAERGVVFVALGAAVVAGDADLGGLGGLVFVRKPDGRGGGAALGLAGPEELAGAVVGVGRAGTTMSKASK